MGGEFVNHFQEGRGQLVNYYASVKPPADGGTPGGVQVVIFDKPRGYTAQWFHDSYVDAYSKNYSARSDQTIDGAACSRFSDTNNTSRVHWECLFGDYEILVAKQEAYGVKIDEVTMLKTLVQRLGGGPQLTPGEIAFRNLLFAALGFGGDAARSCLDEVMNTAEAAAAKDPKMADDLARLRKAAAGAHAIEVLAAVPVGPAHFDDFDPKWWDALKEVVPNPTSTPDPQDTATDRVIDLLPPPLNVLVNIVRTGSKTMRAIKTHVADPTVHREVYACYRRKREGSGGTPWSRKPPRSSTMPSAPGAKHRTASRTATRPSSRGLPPRRRAIRSSPACSGRWLCDSSSSTGSRMRRHAARHSSRGDGRRRRTSSRDSRPA